MLALSQWEFATIISDNARRRMRPSRPAQKSFRMGGGTWRLVIVGSIMVDAGKGTTCIYGLGICSGETSCEATSRMAKTVLASFYSR